MVNLPANTPGIDDDANDSNIDIPNLPYLGWLSFPLMFIHGKYFIPFDVIGGI